MTIQSLSAAFGFSLAIMAVTTLVALLGSHLACNRWPGGLVCMLAFPCLNTASFTLISTCIGSFLSPGNAIMDYEPLRQMCAVWGVAGAVWLASATASVAYLHIMAASPEMLGRGGAGSGEAAAARDYLQLPTQEELGGNMEGAGVLAPHQLGVITPALRRVTVLTLLAWAGVSLIGGLLAQSTLLYQVVLLLCLSAAPALITAISPLGFPV